MNGFFITFEGIDGCGKSTQLDLLAKRLEASGRPVVRTREPGGTDLGTRLREMVLQRGENPLGEMAEVFLFAADRAQHVSQKIRPALESGSVVVCDRFSDSTVAYQGYGGEGDVDTLLRVQGMATLGLKPDMTVLVDLDVETARLRRGPATDRIEDNDPTFHDRVRQGFLKMAAQEPDRFLVVDGTREVEALEAEIFAAFESRCLGRS